MDIKDPRSLEARAPVEEIDLSRYLTILKRRWLPASAAFTLVVVLAGVFAVSQKPTYEAQGKLLLRKKDPTFSLLTDGSDRGQKVGELESLSSLNTPLDTEAEIISSAPLVRETIQRLDLKDDQGGRLKPEDFLKNLTAQGIKGTDVLSVSYKSQDSKESAAVVNTLMNVYIENNVLINRAEATAAREFITDQLPRTEAKLRQAEANLRDFKERNNVTALDAEATSSVAALSDLDGQITKARSNLADASARSLALQSKIGLNPQVAIALNSLSQSPGVQQVLDEYQKVESQLATQRAKYKAPHPEITSLERRESSLRQLLQERVAQVLGNQSVPGNNFQLDKLREALIAQLVDSEVLRQGLINQLNSLAQTRSLYKQRANALPRLEQIQQDLERQMKSAQLDYDVLVKRLQEVKIAENQNVGNARIVASAVTPDKPAASKKKLILAAGIVIGALLYVITAFLLDLRDRSIRSVKELRDLFRYTVLGMIPAVLSGSGRAAKLDDSGIPELPLRDAPHSLVGEAYRMLQANLKFLSPDRQLKTIVITSSVSKEGKSTVSANLATAMSQLGRRILLIDADLRYPIQHHIWNLTNTAGLSDVIVGQSELATVAVEVMPNLTVIPAGAVPPNSLALVDSKRMTTLINDLSADYDFVIIDAPPLVLVADALTLGKLSDGVLLVTRPGVIDTASATAARDLLRQSNQTVLGLVINGVMVEHEPDSYFHHAQNYYKEGATPHLPKIGASKP